MNKILKQQIETAQERFGNKFDYSRYDYQGSKVKSVVICPLHGDVDCLIYAHAKSVYGCTKCGTLVNRSLFSAAYFKKHIPEIVKQHYDLSLFDAKDPNEDSIFICRKDNSQVVCSAVDFVTKLYNPHCCAEGEDDKLSASLPNNECAEVLNNNEAHKGASVTLVSEQKLKSNDLPDNAITFSINGSFWSLSFDPVVRFIKAIGKKIKI